FEGSDAFYEVLQLVAEHARELVGAGWCLATLALDESSEPLTALAAADQGTGANASSVHKLSRLPPGHATRMGAEELAADPASAALARLLGLDRALDVRPAVSGAWGPAADPRRRPVARERAAATLINGANRGLGFEVARRLVAAGHQVWIGARDDARGQQAADMVGARFVNST